MVGTGPRQWDVTHPGTALLIQMNHYPPLCNQTLKLQAPGHHCVLGHHFSDFDSCVLSLWNFAHYRQQLMPIFLYGSNDMDLQQLAPVGPRMAAPPSRGSSAGSRAVTGTEPEPKPLAGLSLHQCPPILYSRDTHVLSAWNKPSSFRGLV